MRGAVTVGAVLVVLGGLASTDPLFAQLGVPTGEQPANGTDVTVRAGDVLRITVWPEATLGGDFVVEETGQVHLPAVGTLNAAGLRLSRLRAQLRSAYGRTMRDPVVTVTTVFRVPALGAVAEPGYYEVTPTQTVYDLIAMAGGFSEKANRSKVRLVRASGTIELNAERALEGDQVVPPPALQPGDQVVVAERSGIRGASARDVLFVLQSIVLAVTLADRIRD